jgi:hypothetical protein
VVHWVANVALVCGGKSSGSFTRKRWSTSQYTDSEGIDPRSGEDINAYRIERERKNRVNGWLKIILAGWRISLRPR